jgi:DNA-binding CsgD family transcriptional regulator
VSARELDVLRQLDGALSTAQIAAALAVSTNTVRGHVRSLLRKFAVARREDAVRCGRELGLLPSRPAGPPGTGPSGLAAASCQPAEGWPTRDGVRHESG